MSRSLLNNALTGLVLLALVTPAMAAESAVFLIPNHAEWKYFAERGEAVDQWQRPGFDDSSWKVGAAGFGYGDGDDTTILRDMRGRYTSVYIRKTFEVEDLNEVASLYLYIKYDDGFIAYLNGHQVAAAFPTRADGRLRVELHEADDFEEFVIHDAAPLLKPGKNVLAIEGHNASLDSSDFSLAPALTTRKIDDSESLLGVEDYLADLAEFERRLLDQSSYLTRRGFDYESRLKAFRESIGGKTRTADFVAVLRKFVMQIGDCHASISWNGWPEPGGYLPLRPADTKEGLAALGINSDEPLDPQCPYIEAIDGVALDQWLDAASQYVSYGAPQFVRHRSLRWLGHTNLIRRELKLPTKDTVLLTLRSADGTKRAEQILRLTGQEYSVCKVNLKRTRSLAGNVGYLRISTMDRRLVRSSVRSIQQFRDTDGMIIDVRDNGGGTYDILRAIYGFFVPGDAKPYVTNIAAYRLSEHFSDDHIGYRPTYRVGWNGWTPEERAAIESTASTFRPEWQPPDGLFSDWHYMILSRERSGHSELDFFFYDKPVVVLSNPGSFSATDGFLSAFASLPQVSMMGEPSGGGSGATRRFQLPNTRVNVALSSMASFQANGKLFDGNGVAVDIRVLPALNDFTTGADSVLERALTILRERHQ